MTENDADRQIAELKAENQRLRESLQKRGIQSADAAQTASRAELSALHETFIADTEFNRQILETSTDCIKILDLDGRLVFMSAGGMRVMEVDDFSVIAMCPWPDFWQGDWNGLASNAVASAKAGKAAHFEGQTPTAKGNMRWWEVVVSPIRDNDGKVKNLLSISRDITARHDADERRNLMLAEMHHRIKNTLATILSITQQSFQNATQISEVERAIRERLMAMGKAHDLLIDNEWISADIRDIVNGALGAYVGDSARVSTSGEAIVLASRAAVTVSMLINELSTNAVKHGAWSNDNGLVSVSWSVERDQFRLRWVEKGGPPVKPPTRRSFGTRLIERALPAALDGTATLRYEPSGLVFEMTAPVASLTTLQPIVKP